MSGDEGAKVYSLQEWRNKLREERYLRSLKELREREGDGEPRGEEPGSEGPDEPA